MRAAVLIVFALCVAAITVLVIETRRLAEVAGAAEFRLWQAQQAAADGPATAAIAANAATVGMSPAAGTPPAAAPAPTATLGPAAIGAGAAAEAQDPRTFAELSLELATTRQQLAAVKALLEARTRELATANAEVPPLVMPEGVRQCLRALHDCLRREGFTNQRFLSARALDQEGLHGVELLESLDDGLGSAVTIAERMTATLDRTKGQLRLVFFGGHRRVAGERQSVDKDGYALKFDGVDGRYLEQALPMLLRVEGEYPQVAAKPAANELGPIDREQWRVRLERLLEGAGTTPLWRVSRLRGLCDANFLDVELVGTDERFRVKSGASVARLAVEIDAQRGVVSLWLQDGVLRSDGGESRIAADGYRVLLPKLTPQQATNTMLGMVVTR